MTIDFNEAIENVLLNFLFEENNTETRAAVVEKLCGEILELPIVYTVICDADNNAEAENQNSLVVDFIPKMPAKPFRAQVVKTNIEFTDI